MIRGVQTAMSAMRAQLARQEVLARNVENLSTAGFKQEYGAIDGFAATLGRVEKAEHRGGVALASAAPVIGSLGVETTIDRVAVDFRQGRIEETNRTLDVALQGDGFLQARTPEGDFYFRGGPLYLDADRRLVTAEGYAVLDSGGQEVVLGEGAINVAADGSIAVDGRAEARLSVVEFQPGTRLRKTGEGLYALDDPGGPLPTAATNTLVKQGFLEASNVDAVSVITEMVSLVRAYQASQRMLQTQDELLGRAVNEVGRVNA